MTNVTAAANEKIAVTPKGAKVAKKATATKVAIVTPTEFIDAVNDRIEDEDEENYFERSAAEVAKNRRELSATTTTVAATKRTEKAEKVGVTAYGLRGAPGKPRLRSFARYFASEAAYRGWAKRKGDVLDVREVRVGAPEDGERRAPLLAV